MAKNKFRSDLSGAIHEMAAGLNKAGVLPDEEMEAIEIGCLLPAEPMSGSKIKTLRKKLHLSQAGLGEVLAVKTNTVSKWEQGVGKPTGPANRLLHVIEKRGIGILRA